MHQRHRRRNYLARMFQGRRASERRALLEAATDEQHAEAAAARRGLLEPEGQARATPPCSPSSIFPLFPYREGCVVMEAFGTRMAIPATPLPVDLSAIRFDPDQQISVITEDGVSVPALKHSTGPTSTNTASQDNKGGSDRDQDQTED